MTRNYHLTKYFNKIQFDFTFFNFIVSKYGFEWNIQSKIVFINFKPFYGLKFKPIKFFLKKCCFLVHYMCINKKQIHKRKEHILIITVQYTLIHANIPKQLWSKNVKILYVFYHSPNIFQISCFQSCCWPCDSDALGKHCIDLAHYKAQC